MPYMAGNINYQLTSYRKGMVIAMREKQNTYSWKDVLGMFVGAESSLGTYILVSTFLLYYYTNIIGLNVAVCSSLIFVSKIFDGVSDMIFGFIIDNTKSKWGACRSWILKVAVPFAVMLLVVFLIPVSDGSPTTAQYVYVFVSYTLLISVCYTIRDISENTLPTFITRNAKGRGMLYAAKGMGAGITAFIVSNYTMVWVQMLGGDRGAWIKLSMIIGVVGICTNLFLVALTEERVVMEKISGEAKISISQIIKAISQNKYWFIVMLILCAGSCVQAGTASIASYYAQYVLNDPMLVGKLLSAFLLPPIAGFFLAGLLLQKVARKPLIVSAVILGLLGTTISAVAHGGIGMLQMGLALRGLAYSLIMGVANTMTADTVEYGQWKTGVRSQGVLMSAKGLGDKIATGLLTAVIGWIMGAAGYDGTLAVQPESAVASINGLFLYIPYVLFILAGILIIFYDLDKKYDGIMKDLAEREARS